MGKAQDARRYRLSEGGLVAAGMMAMNIATYGFNLFAARSLEPRDFGALTALLGIILVGNVVSLGLQAATARRISIAPHQASSIIAATTSVTLVTATSVGAIVAGLTFLLTPLLRLDSALPVILCGATLIPITIMGAQSGIAQGTGHWRMLAVIYTASGLGRVVGGGLAVSLEPTVTSVMIGIAVGAWLPVIAAVALLRLGHRDGREVRGRDLLREAMLGSHALLAYFVLSNLDSIVARNILDVHDSGLYASGLILTKAALFLPQFVSVVVFPDLARDGARRTRFRAAALVLGIGCIAFLATVLLPRLALVLVGGPKYEEIVDRLWLFALAGGLLAVVHLLVFDALARHAHRIVVVLWLAVGAVLGLTYGLGVGITGLIGIVACVAATLTVIVWFVPTDASRPSQPV